MREMKIIPSLWAQWGRMDIPLIVFQSSKVRKPYHEKKKIDKYMI